MLEKMTHNVTRQPYGIAIRITYKNRKSLKLMTGVAPTIDDVGAYLIYPNDPEKHAEIMYGDTFYGKYVFLDVMTARSVMNYFEAIATV